IIYCCQNHFFSYTLSSKCWINFRMIYNNFISTSHAVRHFTSFFTVIFCNKRTFTFVLFMIYIHNFLYLFIKVHLFKSFILMFLTFYSFEQIYKSDKVYLTISELKVPKRAYLSTTLLLKYLLKRPYIYNLPMEIKTTEI